MNTMSSIKILDGFKAVLDTYSLKFDGIKTRASNRGKEIGDERKKYDDELSELFQFIENEKTRLIERAYTVDSDDRKLHQERQQEIEASIRKRKKYYDNKISEINHAVETRKEYVDSCINLLQSTVEIFALFFNCEYLHKKNKKKSILRDFPGNLSPLFGISKDDVLYWYKKYKYAFGETTVEYLHNAFLRIGATVESFLYDSSRHAIKIDESGIIDVVHLLCQEIRSANEIDYNKKKAKMRLEQQEHIENSVYIYVQIILAHKKMQEQRNPAFADIEADGNRAVSNLLAQKSNEIDSLEKTKSQYVSHLQETLDAIKKQYQEKIHNYHNKEDEYYDIIGKRRQKSSESAQKEREATVVELSESLNQYFDKCLDGITVGLSAEPISVREFVALGSNFEVMGSGRSYKTPDDYRTYMCAGSIRFDYANMVGYRLHSHLLKTTRDFLSNYFSGVSGSLFAIDDDGITMPFVVDFTYFEGLCFDYPSEKYDFARQSCQSLMFHMLTDTKASSVYYTMIDSKLPSGFFSIFNSFRGTDARTVAILNNNKVFNTELDIADIMRKQRSAQTTTSGNFGFENIIECNRSMKARKRPINILFITDSANDALLHNAYNDIKTVISGTKHGYSCVFMRSIDSRQSGTTLNSLDFKGTVLEFIDGYLYHVHGTDYNVDFLPLPSTDDITATGNAVSECFRSSTFESIDFEESNSISKIENADQGIIVDGIMYDENNTQVFYELNDIYLNGLILGDPGFGKTKLIHAIIAGMMRKYSPDSVRIHILDYKHHSLGTSVYTRMSLPHIGIVSNLTNRVLGLNFLKYIDAQMNSRAGSYDDSNENIDKFNTYMSWCREQKTLGREAQSYPREVVFIDEVQELIGKNDKISEQCIDIIKKILKLGRASGVHLIMSTQWLLNIEDMIDVELLDTGTQNKVLFYSQGGYGSLKVNPEMIDAVIEKGQALYKLGGIEKVVDVALIEGQEEINFLKKIERTYQLSNTPCNTVMLRNRINDGVSSEFVRFYNGEDIDFSNSPILIGESLEFNKIFALKPNKGLIKFMMISQEQESKHSVFATVILCLLAYIFKSKIQLNGHIMFADFANNCDIVRDTIADALSEANCDAFHYYDSFTAINGIKEQIRSLKDANAEMYVFVNDVGEAMKAHGFNDLFKEINNKIKVNLFVFGDSAEQMTAFEADTICDHSEFIRAIGIGKDSDFSYMLGKCEELDCERGHVVFCRGYDSKNHEIVPFEYETNKNWVKNFIKKIFKKGE